MLCYIGEDEDEVVDLDDPEDGNAGEVITADLSHLHTMDGHPRSRPFHVEGTIGGADVRVPIDTGATMDFLHPRVATVLQLELEPIRPSRVLVGNGASLACTHMSRQTKICMQGTTFTVELHLLEHHGPDVILGMAWLESLGLISADFENKTLEFDRDGRRTFDPGGKPTPHTVIRWSDGLSATTWESLEPIKMKCPDLFLEDKEDSKEGGVDTSTPRTPHRPYRHPWADAGPRDDEASNTELDAGADSTSVSDAACMVPARKLGRQIARSGTRSSISRSMVRPARVPDRMVEDDAGDTSLPDEASTGDTSVPEACMVPGRELRPRRPMKYTS